MAETTKTAVDMLTQWDAGDIVSTIEMGGMGPGYEQAIQILVFEIIRDYAGQTMPAPDSTEMDALRPTFGDAAIKRADESVGGFSGAQVGAAKHLAFRLLWKGWDACKGEVDRDRVTMVSRAWPLPPVFAGAPNATTP